MNGTTDARYVLDTSAVIALLEGSTITSRIREILEGAELFVSVITELELYAKKTMTAEEEAAADAFIGEAVSVVDIGSAVKKTAIALRRSTAIKLPDAIIAATAIVLDAPLLSGDNHLLRLSWPGLATRNIF